MCSSLKYLKHRFNRKAAVIDRGAVSGLATASITQKVRLVAVPLSTQLRGIKRAKNKYNHPLRPKIIQIITLLFRRAIIFAIQGMSSRRYKHVFQRKNSTH